MNAFEFLFRWYQEHCDGDWEHQYGVRINTIDNPGWQVEIDLADTELEDVNLEYELLEKSESNWFGYSAKNKIFKAAGDPEKLETLLNKFREIAEQ